jgi:hypothetical protein
MIGSSSITRTSYELAQDSVKRDSPVSARNRRFQTFFMGAA